MNHFLAFLLSSFSTEKMDMFFLLFIFKDYSTESQKLVVNVRQSQVICIRQLKKID